MWYPAECDVSIRPSWYWHESQDDQVKSLEQLLDIYYKSVGRNSVLPLNVPPNNLGRLPDSDVQRLRELRAVLDETFAVNLAAGKTAAADGAAYDCSASNAADGQGDTCWKPAGDAVSGTLEVDLGESTTFNVSMVKEYIPLGQRVEGYSIEAWAGQTWNPIAKGTTVGHKKLDRFPNVTSDKVRLTISQSQSSPLIRGFGLYLAPVP